MDPAQAPIETDAVVIGAGPVGLFQVFQLGLQEIQAHVIDSLPQAGGQPVELYGDKPIYDIPGIPVCTGRELTQNLLRQVTPFSPAFHFGQSVSTLARQADGRLLVATDRGTRLLARAVFIAAGVGAFEPRRLRVDGLEAFEGTQLHHHLADPAACAGQRVVIVGGVDSALEGAIRLCESAQPPARVTLLHRRDAFQAEPALTERVAALRAQQRLHFVAGQVTGIDTSGQRLAALQVTGPDASTAPLPLDQLLVLQGLSPKLGPIADWGLAMERKQLVVDTERFATSEPGIFAVGDINTYPGKKKLIACGFHEAILAAFAALPVVFPGSTPGPLEYTTSSTRLHRLLKV